jgi:hypothetical protein
MFSNYAPMFIDYAPCEQCNNPDTFGMTCVKCGECGREFNENGMLTNADDYPPYYPEEEKERDES